MEIAEIVKIAEKAEAMQANIESQEKQLKERKKELEHILTEVLPDAMTEEMLQEFKLDSGVVVKLKSIVSGNLPAPGTIAKAKGEEKERLMQRLQDGITWLHSNGAGDLIKNEVSVLMPAGSNELADKAVESLRSLNLTPVRNMTVHPQTLNSYLREAMANGVEIPQEPFGLYTGQVAKFELPKAKKSQKKA